MPGTTIAMVLVAASMYSTDTSSPHWRVGQSVGARRLGIGEFLLQNAINRVLQARSTLGVNAAMVEAKDTQPEAINRKYGFRLGDSKSRQLYVLLGAG